MHKPAAPLDEHPAPAVGRKGALNLRLVREVMTPALVTVAPTATVVEALGILAAHHLHHAPVLNADGELVGVISDAELRRAIRLPALESIDPAGCLHHRMPDEAQGEDSSADPRPADL